MKDEADTKRAYRSRYNKVRSQAWALHQLMANENSDEISGLIIADLRVLVEDITQCFHEFNAYWNVYHGSPAPPSKSGE